MNWLRFLKRMPFYWHFETNYQERCRHRLPHDTLVYTPGIHFRCPNDAVAFSIFQYHLFTPWQRREIVSFLDLAQGCTALLDAGASAGIMSLIFAASRPEGGRILSVEPDPRSLRALRQAVQLNSKPGLDWRISDCALSDHGGSAEMSLSRFGALIREPSADLAPATGCVALRTLPSICEEFDFVPDLIKLDIESYENEVILSSTDLLKRHRPRIHLELHLGMIRGRGADPMQALRTLACLGYRERRLGYHWQRWKSDAERILRTGYPVAHYSFDCPER